MSNNKREKEREEREREREGERERGKERERERGKEREIYLNKWAGCVSTLKAANSSLSLIEASSKVEAYSPKIKIQI